MLDLHNMLAGVSISINLSLIIHSCNADRSSIGFLLLVSLLIFMANPTMKVVSLVLKKLSHSPYSSHSALQILKLTCRFVVCQIHYWLTQISNRMY